MSSIVFVQREVEEKLGVMVLAAFLKSRGHDARIVINPRKHVRRLKKLSPGIIGISVLTPSLGWALATARLLKDELPVALIILGGPHPTFCPEVVEEPGVDAVCVGEGERSLTLLLERYDGTVSSIREIPNLWLKDGGAIFKSPVSPLLSEEELSALPPADRTFYRDYPALRHSPVKSVWTSRGCPLACSYCFNAAYNKNLPRGGNAPRAQAAVSDLQYGRPARGDGGGYLPDGADQPGDRNRLSLVLDPSALSGDSDRRSDRLAAASRRAGFVPVFLFPGHLAGRPAGAEPFFNAQKLFPYLVLKKVSYDRFVRLVRDPAVLSRVVYPPVF